MASDTALPAAPPVQPAHPPIPLTRAPSAPALPPAPAGPGAGERAFLRQSSGFAPALAAQRAAAAPRRITAPIPLQLTGPTLRTTPLRALPVPTAPVPPEAAPAPAPSDIPQRMSEALNKYRQLLQQRGATLDLQQ